MGYSSPSVLVEREAASSVAIERRGWIGAAAEEERLSLI